MNNDDQQGKKGPSHRISFARLNGRDERGKDVLGPAREIGSIWPRKDREGEAILRFDHIPEELRSQGGGVLFVKAIDAGKERNAGGDDHAASRPRNDHDVERDR